MPLEIKGLGQNVQAARDAIRKARSSIETMNGEGAKLSALAEEIAATFKQHHDDLMFEAQTLGNSPPASPEPEKPFPAPGAGNGAG